MRRVFDADAADGVDDEAFLRRDGLGFTPRRRAAADGSHVFLLRHF